MLLDTFFAVEKILYYRICCSDPQTYHFPLSWPSYKRIVRVCVCAHNKPRTCKLPHTRWKFKSSSPPVDASIAYLTAILLVGGRTRGTYSMHILCSWVRYTHTHTLQTHLAIHHCLSSSPAADVAAPSSFFPGSSKPHSVSQGPWGVTHFHRQPPPSAPS